MRPARRVGDELGAGDVTSADVSIRATQVAPDGSGPAGLVYAVTTINLKLQAVEAVAA